jgi:hypothetical protein
MEVGQGPNWGCSAKEKNTLDQKVSRQLLAVEAHVPS